MAIGDFADGDEFRVIQCRKSGRYFPQRRIKGKDWFYVFGYSSPKAFATLSAAVNAIEDEKNAASIVVWEESK